VRSYRSCVLSEKIRQTFRCQSRRVRRALAQVSQRKVYKETSDRSYPSRCEDPDKNQSLLRSFEGSKYSISWCRSTPAPRG